MLFNSWPTNTRRQQLHNIGSCFPFAIEKNKTVINLLYDEGTTHRRRHLSCGHRLVGGPCERVRRPAGHAVDLLALLQGGHQARPLDGVGRPVAQLTLVVVAPREHLACGKNMSLFKTRSGPKIAAAVDQLEGSDFFQGFRSMDPSEGLT